MTLEEIGRRKKALRKEMEEQMAVIIASSKKLFSPTPSETSLHPLMRNFNTGFAIFDGVMTGIKLIRRVKAFFKRMK